MSLNSSSAAIVALTTLIALPLPIDLVKISLMPADSTTALTAPPAITPVPLGAGFNKTVEAQNLLVIWCGIVVPFIGTCIMLLLAVVTAFRTASGTA